MAGAHTKLTFGEGRVVASLCMNIQSAKLKSCVKNANSSDQFDFN